MMTKSERLNGNNKMIINQNTMSYDMISRVLSDHRKSKKAQKQFVADHWK